MDFIVHSALHGDQSTSLILSYDIACQWSRHFAQRNQQFNHLRLSDTLLENTTFVIPKFHIYAHGPACQTNFSLNYVQYSGRSDGEDPERWWSHINPISMQTREMGPGARIDLLDDHAIGWNWRKIIGFGMPVFFTSTYCGLHRTLGDLLAKKFDMAIVMRNKSRESFVRYNATYDEELTERWEKMVKDWDADKSSANPYEEPRAGEH
jgi:hypothetical protein